MDEIYFDWDSNCDVIVFKVTVPDSLATTTEKEAEAEERDMHRDFGYVSQLELAADRLSKEAREVREKLELRYPELY